MKKIFVVLGIMVFLFFVIPFVVGAFVIIWKAWHCMLGLPCTL